MVFEKFMFAMFSIKHQRVVVLILIVGLFSERFDSLENSNSKLIVVEQKIFEKFLLK